MCRDVISTGFRETVLEISSSVPVHFRDEKRYIDPANVTSCQSGEMLDLGYELPSFRCSFHSSQLPTAEGEIWAPEKG